MTLGERIKRLRERRDWNQRELARRAQVDHAWIYRLENGERHNISLEAAKRLATALGVSLDVMAGMHAEELGSDPAPDAPTAPPPPSKATAPRRPRKAAAVD
jgi:transcriptional regulator with XRE-family HTH domain